MYLNTAFFLFVVDNNQSFRCHISVYRVVGSICGLFVSMSTDTQLHIFTVLCPENMHLMYIYQCTVKAAHFWEISGANVAPGCFEFAAFIIRTGVYDNLAHEVSKKL